MRLGITIIFIIFSLDQLSKLWILQQFVYSKGLNILPYAYYYDVIELLPFLNIRLVWNTGISFSLFSSGGAFTMYVILIIQIMIVLLISVLFLTFYVGWCINTEWSAIFSLFFL